MDALANLLTHKPFEDISVQEIVEESTLTRTTFYLHYPDKNSLLQAMTTKRFGELAERRGLTFADGNGNLREIALGVCDYLTEALYCPGQLPRMALEGAIIPIVEDLLRRGARGVSMEAGAGFELVSTAAAWAIFGCARSWFETSDGIPAEEMAVRIEAIVRPLLSAVSLERNSASS
ncbi:transcriptional regulator, TetR family [Granulicella rosea]|uniref:Transcriptional regulator, TetR family n=2 Tax=Granulicella rosea TaxID=474952 RepID=A0A239JZH2_9BACT|nr:transcriptional regulator, TetR family [Granulicella rosea]